MTDQTLTQAQTIELAAQAVLTAEAQARWAVKAAYAGQERESQRRTTETLATLQDAAELISGARATAEGRMQRARSEIEALELRLTAARGRLADAKEDADAIDALAERAAIAEAEVLP